MGHKCYPLFNAASRTHDCPTLTRLRRFVEAVLAYTKATQIAIVSHSMGVTLGRKIVQGGAVTGGNGTRLFNSFLGNCDLGASLIKKVDTFVGLSGANYGMCNCEGGDAFISATCNQQVKGVSNTVTLFQNGFWPGDTCGLNDLLCGDDPLPWPCDQTTITYSSYLANLNNNNAKEGTYLFSAWSLGRQAEKTQMCFSR